MHKRISFLMLYGLFLFSATFGVSIFTQGSYDMKYVLPYAYGDNLSNLTTEQLMARYQNDINTLGAISKISDEAVIVDSANQTTTILRNKASDLVADGQADSSLMNILDLLPSQISKAGNYVLSLDVAGVNNILNATNLILSDFISQTQVQREKQISSAIADELISDANRIITNNKKRNLEVLTLLESHPTLTLSGANIQLAKDTVNDTRAITKEMQNRGFTVTIDVRRDNETLATMALPSEERNVELQEQQLNIPNWVRQNAKWWSDGKIQDSDFVQGIQYLIRNGIMRIPDSEPSSGSSQEIPIWIKTNAGWWADGKISDNEFVSAIQYLVANGIIKI